MVLVSVKDLVKETIRTYFLFIGKDIIKKRISSSLRESVDIYPTLLELVGIQTKINGSGESFSKYLKNDQEELNDKEYVYSETGAIQGPYPSPMKPNVFCVKTPSHKLIYLKTIDEWKLFNLKDDPNEMNNIFNKDDELSNKLREKLITWINR